MWGFFAWVFCVLGGLYFFNFGGVLIFCFFLVWGFVEVFLTWVFCFVVWFWVGCFLCLLLWGLGFCCAFVFWLFCLGVLVFWGALPSHRHPNAQAHTLDSLVSPICIAVLPLPDATLHAGDTVPGARLTS